MKCDWCPTAGRYAAVLGAEGSGEPAFELWSLTLCETHADMLGNCSGDTVRFPDKNGSSRTATEWAVREL